MKVVYTRLCSKNRTQWHTRRNRGLPSLDHSAALCRQRNTLYSATLLYTYISRFSVNPQHQQKRKIWQSCCHKFYPPTVFHPAFQLLAQMAHVCFHGRKRVHARLCQQDRTQRPTRRNRGVSDGGAISTLGPFCAVRKPCMAGCQNGKLCRFWVLAGCTQKNAESLGTAMRLCASLSRGVAAPLGCVIFLQLGDVAVFSLCAQYFLIVRGGGGITTLSALCVLLKRRTAACQNGSFAVF